MRILSSACRRRCCHRHFLRILGSILFLNFLLAVVITIISYRPPKSIVNTLPPRSERRGPQRIPEYYNVRKLCNHCFLSDFLRSHGTRNPLKTVTAFTTIDPVWRARNYYRFVTIESVASPTSFGGSRSRRRFSDDRSLLSCRVLGYRPKSRLGPLRHYSLFFYYYY